MRSEKPRDRFKYKRSDECYGGQLEAARAPEIPEEAVDRPGKKRGQQPRTGDV